MVFCRIQNYNNSDLAEIKWLSVNMDVNPKVILAHNFG